VFFDSRCSPRPCAPSEDLWVAVTATATRTDMGQNQSHMVLPTVHMMMLIIFVDFFSFLIVYLTVTDPYEPHLHLQQYSSTPVNPFNVLHPSYEMGNWELITLLTVVASAIMVMTIQRPRDDPEYNFKV
jgi:hypothetical protein